MNSLQGVKEDIGNKYSFVAGLPRQGRQVGQRRRSQRGRRHGRDRLHVGRDGDDGRGRGGLVSIWGEQYLLGVEYPSGNLLGWLVDV